MKVYLAYFVLLVSILFAATLIWLRMPKDVPPDNGGAAPEMPAEIELRLFEGLTIRETSGRMGCSESRVRTTQTDAIRILRKQLTLSGESGYDSKEESSDDC